MVAILNSEGRIDNTTAFPFINPLLSSFPLTSRFGEVRKLTPVLSAKGTGAFLSFVRCEEAPYNNAGGFFV